MKNNEDVIFEKDETITFITELKHQYESSISRKYLRRKSKLFDSIPIRRQMLVFADDYVSNKILSHSIYERPQLELILEWLKTKNNIFNKTIIDIGANIGNHSLFFSNYFSKCISFEPNPRTFSVLEINARLANNVYPKNIGLSDKKCTARLYTNFKNVGASSLSHKWNKEVDNYYDIHLDKLDDILNKNEKVGVMKLDVEGHEWCAIKGAEQVIKDNKPIIIFEHNAIDDDIINDKDVIHLLSSYGYNNFYEIIDGWAHLKQQVDRAPKYLRSILRWFFIISRKTIPHRIVRVNVFKKIQYPIIIACASRLN